MLARARGASWVQYRTLPDIYLLSLSLVAVCTCSPWTTHGAKTPSSRTLRPCRRLTRQPPPPPLRNSKSCSSATSSGQRLSRRRPRRPSRGTACTRQRRRRRPPPPATLWSWAFCLRTPTCVGHSPTTSQAKSAALPYGCSQRAFRQRRLAGSADGSCASCCSCTARGRRCRTHTIAHSCSSAVTAHASPIPLRGAPCGATYQRARPSTAKATTARGQRMGARRRRVRALAATASQCQPTRLHRRGRSHSSKHSRRRRHRRRHRRCQSC